MDINKKTAHKGGFFVVLLRLELRQTEPESAVLPLHHRTISPAKVIKHRYKLNGNIVFCGDYLKFYSFPAIFDQLSFNVTVRLKTSFSDVES